MRVARCSTASMYPSLNADILKGTGQLVVPLKVELVGCLIPMAAASAVQKPGEEMVQRVWPIPWTRPHPPASACTRGSSFPPAVKVSRYTMPISLGQLKLPDGIGGSSQAACATERAWAGSVTVILAGNVKCG